MASNDGEPLAAFIGLFCDITASTVDLNQTKIDKPLGAKRMPLVVDEVLSWVDCKKWTLLTCIDMLVNPLARVKLP